MTGQSKLLASTGGLRGAASPTPKMIRAVAGLALLLIFPTTPAHGKDPGRNPMTLSLTSTGFENGGEIPKKYTCQGDDISVPLAWSGLPAGTESLVLIVDDPDAPDPAKPRLTWVHWVLFNLPPSAKGLEENVQTLPAGTREGLNDWKRTGYGGPCPPIGRHRYFHKLFALDTVLPDLGTPNKAELEAAIKGHVLAKVELVGTYQKD